MEFKDYEKHLEELKSIVERLEQGELTLEETIQAYRKGMELHKKLDECLRSTDGELTRIESADPLGIETEWNLSEEPNGRA